MAQKKHIYILEPFGEGAASLRSYTIEPHSTFSVILGRNADTGLDKVCDHVQHVSRNHVAVNVRSGRVFIDPIARQENIVFFNNAPCARGEREMLANDSFSLLGTISWFNYRLVDPTNTTGTQSPSNTTSSQSVKSKRDNVIELTDDNPRASKKAKTSHEVVSLMSSSSSDKLKSPPTLTSSSSVGELNKTIVEEPKDAQKDTNMSEIIKGLLRQYECAICYETMACACNLSPCGDSFCFTCIEDWAQHHSNCPLCSEKFDLKNVVPSKLVDNAVREILKSDKAELDSWEARVDEGNKKRKEFVAKATAAPVVVVDRVKVNYDRAYSQMTSRPRVGGASNIVDLTSSGGDRGGNNNNNNNNNNNPRRNAFV